MVLESDVVWARRTGDSNLHSCYFTSPTATQRLASHFAKGIVAPDQHDARCLEHAAEEVPARGEPLPELIRTIHRRIDFPTELLLRRPQWWHELPQGHRSDDHEADIAPCALAAYGG